MKTSKWQTKIVLCLFLIGAGSTITMNVPPYALALCRAEQKVIEGWVARKRPELLKKAGLSVPAVKKEMK